jgi:hypothetical protein
LPSSKSLLQHTINFKEKKIMDKKSKKLSTKVHTDSFTGKNDSPTSPTDKRGTLKKLVVSSTIVAGSGMLVPTKWASPVVQSTVLPAHADTTETTTTTTTGGSDDPPDPSTSSTSTTTTIPITPSTCAIIKIEAKKANSAPVDVSSFFSGIGTNNVIQTASCTPGTNNQVRLTFSGMTGFSNGDITVDQTCAKNVVVTGSGDVREAAFNLNGGCTLLQLLVRVNTVWSVCATVDINTTSPGPGTCI